MGLIVNPDSIYFRINPPDRPYVEKTGLLKYMNRVLNTPEGYILMSMPHGWGKTFLSRMTASYYSLGSDYEKLFSSLEIGKDASFRDHLNSHDVIYINAEGCIYASEGEENTVPFITRKIISELGEYYPGKVPASCESVAEALTAVSETTGRKFVFVIDDWDGPVRVGRNREAVAAYLQLLESIFDSGNTYTSLAFMAGVLPLPEDVRKTSLGRFREFSLSSPGSFAPYLGLTGGEVRALCSEYRCDYDSLSSHCGGYESGGVKVFSPRIVLRDILGGDFRISLSQTDSL